MNISIYDNVIEDANLDILSCACLGPSSKSFGALGVVFFSIELLMHSKKLRNITYCCKKILRGTENLLELKLISNHNHNRSREDAVLPAQSREVSTCPAHHQKEKATCYFVFTF
ncbi:hypothetical protein ACJX0J_032662, partial [Zea mays]